MTDEQGAIDHPSESRPFRYDGEVKPGEKRHLRCEISETYLGDPVEIPVTVINGAEPGPRICLTAAVHGDELNGVKVCQKVADHYDPGKICGTLVIVHVVNVPAYQGQQRYIPIYDQDLNRCFPGRPDGNTAARMAHEVFERFVAPCDRCLDFHTSTRNRTTMYHVRADVSNPAVEELARAFGTNLIIGGAGESGSLRTAATAAGTPTVTVEMGRPTASSRCSSRRRWPASSRCSPSTASCRTRPSLGQAGSASSAARARSRGSGRIRAVSSTCGGAVPPGTGG